MIGLNAAKFKTIAIPGLSKIPVIGAVFNQDPLTYIVLLCLPIAWFFMYKTKHGLNLRAVGENPQTADAMGINVTAVRYIYTVFGGIMAGIGGAHPLAGLYSRMDREYYRRPGMDCNCACYFFTLESVTGHLGRNAVWWYKCGAVSASGVRG